MWVRFFILTSVRLLYCPNKPLVQAVALARYTGEEMGAKASDLPKVTQ